MKQKCCQRKEFNKKIHDLNEFLKVISDENRLRVLCILKNGPRCVCDIWEELELNQNLVSHHLKALKEFGLLESQREGSKIYYSISSNNINKYLKSLNNFLTKYEN